MLGSGTLGDPYIIQDVTDLQNMNLAFRIIDRTISDKLQANTYLRIPVGVNMYEGEEIG